MRAQGHYGLAGENSDCCIFICIQVWVCESLFIRQSIPWFTKHKFYILFTEPSAHWNLLADWAGQVLSVLTWDACVLKKPSGQGMEWCSQKWQGGSPYCQKLWRHMWTYISPTVWLLQGHEGQRWVSWDEREDGPWLGGGEAAGRGLDRLPLPLDGGIVV